MSTCCKFEPFGYGDGQKIVCANARQFSGPGCWVVSLGCNGHWEFERDIVKRTNCFVHTFDCTGDWDVPKDLKDRVQLHKVCIGTKEDDRKEYVPWETIVSYEKGMPAMLKMDVEGFEFPVMQEMVLGNAKLFPEQIAVEVHATKAKTEFIASLFANLTSKGFHLVHRADNPFCASCSEVTLVRDSGLPLLV